MYIYIFFLIYFPDTYWVLGGAEIPNSQPTTVWDGASKPPGSSNWFSRHRWDHRSGGDYWSISSRCCYISGFGTSGKRKFSRVFLLFFLKKKTWSRMMLDRCLIIFHSSMSWVFCVLFFLGFDALKGGESSKKTTYYDENYDTNERTKPSQVSLRIFVGLWRWSLLKPKVKIGNFLLKGRPFLWCFFLKEGIEECFFGVFSLRR